jgi:hypothetical protein
MKTRGLPGYIPSMLRPAQEGSPMARHARQVIDSRHFNGRKIGWLRLKMQSAALRRIGTALQRAGAQRYGLRLLARGDQFKAQYRERKIAYLSTKQQKLNRVSDYAMESFFNQQVFGVKTELTDRLAALLAKKIGRGYARLARQKIKHDMLLLRANSCQLAGDTSRPASDQAPLLQRYGQVEMEVEMEEELAEPIKLQEPTVSEQHPSCPQPPLPAPRSKRPQGLQQDSQPQTAMLQPVPLPRRRHPETPASTTLSANPRGPRPELPEKKYWLAVKLRYNQTLVTSETSDFSIRRSSLVSTELASARNKQQ